MGNHVPVAPVLRQQRCENPGVQKIRWRVIEEEGTKQQHMYVDLHSHVNGTHRTHQSSAVNLVHTHAKHDCSRAVEVAQQLGARRALPEDLSAVPRMHVG